MRKVRKNTQRDIINLYDKSLFLSDLNLKQTIQKIDRVDAFGYTKSMLNFLRLLSGNSFTNLQEFFRTQGVVNSVHETASVNMLGTTGQLLISLTELDIGLYNRPDVFF